MNDEMLTSEAIEVDVTNLYREETYTDLKVASIKRFIPVTPDGREDTTREPVFLGQTSIYTPAGVLPVTCEIKARTLEEAIRMFPEAVDASVADLIQEARRLQREEASRIVVPQPGAAESLIKLK